MAGTVCVLVVDDDVNACALTERLLTKRGYQVTTCSESPRVLDLLKASAYDCVLLDVRMQGLQGTELLPIIKRHYPALPVIIVSAFCDQSDTAYYASLGAFELLAKPFEADRLFDVISRAVGATETVPIVLTTLLLSDAQEQVYRKLIVAALRRTNWNQIKAAHLLGVSRYTLIRWLRKLQISY